MSVNNNDNIRRSSPTSGNSPELSSTFNPLQMLMKRRWQLFACLMIVCGIALGSVIFLTPKYKATSQVRIVTGKPQGGGLAGLLGGGGSDIFSTQCELLKSRKVLGRAAEKLAFAKEGWAYSDDTIDEMRDRVRIRPISGSNLIDIVGISYDPTEAAAVANQVMVSFVEISTESRKSRNKNIVDRISGRIADFDRETNELEKDIEKFRSDNQITGTDSVLQANEARIMAMEKELTKISMQRLVMENKSNLYKSLMSSVGDSSGKQETELAAIGADSTIRSIRRELNDMQQEEKRLARIYLPGHDTLRNIRLHIEDLKSNAQHTKQVVIAGLNQSIQSEIEAVVDRQDSLEQMLTQQRQKGVTLTNRHQKYKKMLAGLELSHRLKSEMEAQLRQFILKEDLNESPVVVVDSAHVPTKVAGLSTANRAGLILLLGLLFSVVFVLSLDRFGVTSEISQPQSQMTMNVPGFGQVMPVMLWPGTAGAGGFDNIPTTETNKETARGTQVPVLGRITSMELGAGQGDNVFAVCCRIVHADQSSSASGEFRQISTNLLGRFGQTRQSMVLTSTKSGVGKTTCASNLALMLAQSGRKVVLVGANPRNDDLSKVFTLSEDKLNIGEYGEDPTLLDNSVQETDVPNLSVLQIAPATDISARDSLDSLTELNKDLGGRFDWVLYDCGTLQMEVTRDLLQVVGKSLFVSTGIDSSDELSSMEKIERYGALSVGCIENLHSVGIGQEQPEIEQHS